MPVHAQPFAPRIGRIAKRRIGVPAHRAQRHGEVGAGVLVQQCLVAPGRIAITHRRQFVDLQHDGFERILCARACVGDNQRNRFADVTHLVTGDHRLLEHQQRRMGFLAQRDARHHRADIGCGDHRDNPGHGEAGLGVDRADTAVRHRAAQDCGRQHAGARHVPKVSAAALQETTVLDALDRPADIGRGVFQVLEVGHGVQATLIRTPT